MSEHWTLADLKSFARTLLETHRVIAPVPGADGPVWGEVHNPEEIVWDYGRTSVSPRSWVLPRCETLFRYDVSTNPPRIEEPSLETKPTALLLLRSCDVAGLRALDAVMRWDYEDEPYEARRKATLFVALGCDAPPSPEACFCESVGIDPRWAPDADIMVVPARDEGGTRYTVHALSEEGRTRLENAPGPLAQGRPEPKPIGTVPIDVERSRRWMKDHFEDPSWARVAEACMGCGTCAFVCPSCHCFDVLDEGDWRRGERVRFWDSCAFDHFTQHASGHNPRPNQASRYRQRVYHKFVYYPDKFGRLLCTGCGRCVDACPGGVDLVEVLQGIGQGEAKQA